MLSDRLLTEKQTKALGAFEGMAKAKVCKSSVFAVT